MLLAKTNTQREGIRKHTLDRPVQFGQISLKFMFVGLLGALALLYLAQSTQGASRSYQLRALEDERKELRIERERLQVEAIRLRSLDGLQKDYSTTPAPDGAAASWEPVNSIAYMKTVSPVAQRQP